MRPVFANDQVQMRQRVPVAYRSGDLIEYHQALTLSILLRRLVNRL